MKRIVYVIGRIESNAPNEVLYNIIKNLEKSEFNVTIIALHDSPNNNQLHKYRKLNIECTSLGLATKHSAMSKGAASLSDKLNEIGPDIVHSHGLFADYVLSKQSNNFVKISTIHNTPSKDYVNRFGRIPGILLGWWHIRTLSKLDTVFACSESSGDTLKKFMGKKPLIARNGIDVDLGNTEGQAHSRYRMRRKLNLSETDTVYIYAGKLTKGKNVSKLVENFSRYHQTNDKLLILGAGPELDKIKSQCHKDVQILGHVDAPKDYYIMADVYISASKTEGFSLSVIEALYCGLYLFLSDIPPHREVLSIDGEKFIGSVFNQLSFDKDLKIFKRLYKGAGKRKAPQIYAKNNLNSKTMANQYIRVYRNEV